MRLKQRSTVVLPHPDGPMNAVISFLWIVEVDVAHGPERAVEHRERRRARTPAAGAARARCRSAVVDSRSGRRVSVSGGAVGGVVISCRHRGFLAVGHADLTS